MWDRLTPKMQVALVDGWNRNGERIQANEIRLPTREALRDRGIAWTADHDSDLTPLGVLVREVGTRTHEEVDDAADAA
jgi:hypothetical protein